MTERSELLGRGAELAALAAAVDRAAAGAGQALLVEGPAGIGKTALADAARALTTDAGLLPLRARGTELERAFGFGVVRQLLEPAVHGPRARGLDGAKSRTQAADRATPPGHTETADRDRATPPSHTETAGRRGRSQRGPHETADRDRATPPSHTETADRDRATPPSHTETAGAAEAGGPDHATPPAHGGVARGDGDVASLFAGAAAHAAALLDVELAGAPPPPVARRRCRRSSMACTG